MCGRYTLTSNLDELQASFKFEARDLEYRPRFNIAPTQQNLVVTNDGTRSAEYMRWGLLPFWVKDAKAGARMINAVSETASAKPAFRAAFRKRRCLVLANGFFEWRKEGKARIPNYFFSTDHAPLAFAGLWETWKSPDGERIKSFTILTTKANQLIQPIHDRMPVILSGETQALWLDPLTEDTEVLGKLLTPAPDEDLDVYQVSNLVNSPKNNGPECIQQVAGAADTLAPRLL